MAHPSEKRPPERPGVRPWATATLPIGVSLLLVFLFWGTLGPGAQIAVGLEAGSELERLRRETRALNMEAGLAAGAKPYLILDLREPVLVLKLQGVALREFPVLDAWARGRRPAGGLGERTFPLDSIWGPGTLLPAVHRKREVIYSDSVTPLDPSGPVAFIPPSPEEAVPGPHSFRIRFPGRLSLLVTGAAAGEDGTTGEGAAGASAASRMVHWFRLAPWRRDAARLEIRMPGVEAGALYRAFSPGTRLIVVGAARPAAGTEGKT